jgi:outer membrane usher protein
MFMSFKGKQQPGFASQRFAFKKSHLMVLVAIAGFSGKVFSENSPAPGGQPSGPVTTSADTTFDPSFLLNTPGGAIDVSRFEHGNPVLPGDYSSDIYVNGAMAGRNQVSVRARDGDTPLLCLNKSILDLARVDFSGVSEQNIARLADPKACLDIRELIPGATASFDSSALRLDLNIPQASLKKTARGYVDPALWDSGVTAGFVSYTANAYRTATRQSYMGSGYVGITSGFNVGGWMFRHDGALTWQDGSKRQYTVTDTYAEHDITPLKARITLGDSNTPGEVFDTFALRGVQLATDDRMLPDSLRGYAPVIRGIANSNARVTVRQNGAILYDAAVPPGPFLIDDLYPTGYGGNLDVSVTEADGSVRTFRVPYAAIPQLLRPGIMRYNVAVGAVRGLSLSYTPYVFQGTIQRGLTDHFTGYGGLLASNGYTAIELGTALSTPIGAFAVDITGAQTTAGATSMRGISIQTTYSELISATQSNFSLAAYRFSSSGYLSFSDALTYIDAERRASAIGINTLYRARNRLSVTATQQLGGRWGQVFVSGYTQDYWNRTGVDTQFQGGYSNHFRDLDYSITLARSRNSMGQMDNQIMATLTLPLGVVSHPMTVSVDMTHDSNAGTTARTMLSGSYGEQNQLNYTVGASHDTDSAMVGSGSVQYRSQYTALQGAIEHGAGYYSGSVGMSGAVVVHPGGITATPYPVSTMAVVAAPDAGGAKVGGYPGIQLDPRGYAIVPYLDPYRMNEVSIDPKGIPANVELETTSQDVAPRDGAVVMLRFATRKGQAVLITPTLPQGVSLPFGASVVDEKGNNVGTVMQGGRIYARLSKLNDRLSVELADGDKRQCTFAVNLPQPAKGKDVTMEQLNLSCELSTVPESATRSDSDAGSSTR